MAELRSPFGGAVIEVSDDLVDRFVVAGWIKGGKAPAKSDKKPEPSKAPAKSDKK